MKERIFRKLSDNLIIKSIEIINESQMHNGHKGYDGSGESHFKLIISCDELSNGKKIDSHRIVNNLLSEEFKNGLHALSVKLV